MKKLARYLLVSTVLFLAILGTTLSNNPAISRAEDPHRDPVCIDACNFEFQACFAAAQPNRHEVARCRSERQHCLAHCK